MKTFLTLAASLLALGATAAHADHHGGDKMSAADKFEKMDADADGNVTEAEFLASFEEKVAMKQEEGKWTDWTDQDIMDKGVEKFEEIAGDDPYFTLADLEESWEDKKEEKKDAMEDAADDMEDAADDMEDEMDDM